MSKFGGLLVKSRYGDERCEKRPTKRGARKEKKKKELNSMF